MNHVDLAKLCKESYAPLGIVKAEEIGGLAARCYVLDQRPKVIVFRGTSDKAGWLQDVWAKQVQHQGGAGLVHAGFLESWNAIRKQVIKAAGKSPVVITGHSLGGALATLAALDLPSAEVVTFGSPRVGDVDLVGAYQARTAGKSTRYVHLLDPVPFVPGSLAGYQHVCPAKWYDGNRWRGTNAWTWCLAAWQRLFVDHDNLWHDHAIDRYLDALKTEAKR